MTCPHCEAEITHDQVTDEYDERDCPTYFTIDCEHCGEEIDVQVGARPAFQLNLPGATNR